MIVIKSPYKYDRKENDIMVFLAGGITNCNDWQEEVINELKKYDFDDNIIIMSPRCDTFDITDPKATLNQITWEYTYLSDMDIFSMYFCNSPSDQPICMYELGRYISDMSHRFPKYLDDRIIIGIEDGYKRENDVIIQTKLALNNSTDNIHQHMNPKKYARRLASRIKFVQLVNAIF